MNERSLCASGRCHVFGVATSSVNAIVSSAAHEPASSVTHMRRVAFLKANAHRLQVGIYKMNDSDLIKQEFSGKRSLLRAVGPGNNDAARMLNRPVGRSRSADDRLLIIHFNREAEILDHAPDFGSRRAWSREVAVYKDGVGWIEC